MQHNVSRYIDFLSGRGYNTGKNIRNRRTQMYMQCLRFLIVVRLTAHGVQAL